MLGWQVARGRCYGTHSMIFSVLLPVVYALMPETVVRVQKDGKRSTAQPLWRSLAFVRVVAALSCGRGTGRLRCSCAMFR